jgi:hypothetical protein
VGNGNELIESKLDCLYYPFSRLLDATTLKYLLLVYDSITFLDEAESTAWRRRLLEQMQPISPLFGQFEVLFDHYNALEEAGVFRVLRAEELSASNSNAVAMSVLADLKDESLTQIASRPERFGLPFLPSDAIGLAQSRPTWQIFEGKIPQALQQVADSEARATWVPHVLRRGDYFQSWSLSYEAGSICTINYYLEAAHELGLTPITNSRLHHQLVLRKLKRTIEALSDADGSLDSETRSRCRSAIGHGEILRLLDGIFPSVQLERVSIAEILKFRRETTHLRQAFLHEICETIRVLDGDPSSPDFDRQVAVAVRDLQQQLLAVRAEFSAARDKLLPSITDGVLYGAAGTGALGSLGTFLGGLPTAGLVAASALTIGGALASKAAQCWAERRQILRNQTGAVAYLLELNRLVQ